MTALLLKPTYEPLTVVTRNRAVKMVLAGRVSVLDEDESKPVRSAKFIMPEPKVLLMHEMVKTPYRAAPPCSRRGVLVRDGYKCAYCGAFAETWDHIIPRSEGGKSSWENTVAACKWCNSHKGNKFLDDIGWELKVQPRQPSGAYWVLVGVKEPDPKWRPWLN